MKNPGTIVIIRGGKKGRTYNNKGLINGKTPVYLEKDGNSDKYHEQAVLVEASKMTIVGYID